MSQTNQLLQAIIDAVNELTKVCEGTEDFQLAYWDQTEQAWKPLNVKLPPPDASDDQKFLQYDHTTGNIIFTALPGGTGVDDKHYVHHQDAALATWSIAHNLGKRPAVSIVDSGGNLVVGDVEYVDADNLTITFSSAFSGKAYLN